MDCLDCGGGLQWSESVKTHREKTWIEQGIISPESGTQGMGQPAAKYRCSDCGAEYKTKFFTFKNQPGDAEAPSEVAKICEEYGILGLGYGGSPIQGADSVPTNAREAAKIFDEYFEGKIRMANRDFVIWMEEGDFVYTHDPHRKPTQYFQTRVTGDIQASRDPNATLHGEPLSEETREELLRQDISLYREAEWKPISKDRLPGPFHRDVPIKNGTIRKIKSNLSANVARNAVRLWDGTLEANLSIEALHTTVADSAPSDVVNCLNEIELEEVISSLIQEQEDAVMQLNTAVSSQPDTEVILRTSENGEPHTIYFQVKSNADPGTLGDLGAGTDESLYVYAGGREGDISHAEYLTDEQVYRYVKSNLPKIPATIRDTLSRQLS